METNWTELLQQLAEPFPADAIEWRAGATTRDKKKAQALPYASSRVYEDRLNEVCLGDWGCVFKAWGDTRIIAELTIHGVTRSSTGESEGSGGPQGTTSEAQAFKRACSKFGLGRYLYDMPSPWVDYDAQKSKLLETPKLPSRFLPRVKGAQASPTTPPRGAQTPSEAPKKLPNQPIGEDEGTGWQDEAPRLSEDRAKAMATELQKLGFEPREQMKLATSVLGTPVRAFTELSEADALEVWASAKRLSKRLA